MITITTAAYAGRNASSSRVKWHTIPVTNTPTASDNIDSDKLACPSVRLIAAPTDAPIKFAVTRVSEARTDGCMLGCVTITADTAAHTPPGSVVNPNSSTAATAAAAAFAEKISASK